MNTRFDIGDKAYVEVTILGISINEDGVRYLVRADKDTFITIDKYLLKPIDDVNKQVGTTDNWRIQKATDAIMYGVDCAEIASALNMTPEEVEDLKTQMEGDYGENN